ncbi:MAG: hypothetical protein ABJE95_03180 [Byssovorax sp.]
MTWSTIAPTAPEGWEGFTQSKAVTDLLWRRLRTWHYLSFSSGTSTWEDPDGSCALLNVDYTDERIVDLSVDLTSDDGPGADTLRELLSELESVFALRIRAPSSPPAE